MDANEATKTVLSRIQTLDPQHASKIMGYILLQDTGEKEMIRLAFGPETLLISLINQVKSRLGLLSNTSSAPPTPSPFATKLNPFSQQSPRIVVPNNGFGNPFSPPSRSGLSSNTSSADVNESFSEENSSPQNQFHRRSYSVNDAFVGGLHEDISNNGFGGFRPCMYYARGFCKNGDSCKFVHDDDGGFCDSSEGSPGKFDCFYEEVLRVKALQEKRERDRIAAAQFMAAGPRHPFAYNKCMNVLNDNQRSAAAAAALMMSDEFHRYGRSRTDRNDFSAIAPCGNSNSSSRQIYLTFPADSTFKEEDVSNYFSMYGPVQDVRIPYQQKRMFGFVTFVYPETVKLILAKGNPHFVCDSRVLVKPYKEKGKVTDRKQLQQPMDCGELSPCLSPSGVDFGARMFYNSQEMMLRRRLEQEAELQQAIDLQGRKLMNMRLMDMNSRHHDNHFQSDSEMQSQFHDSQGLVYSSSGIDQEVLAENNGAQELTETPADAAAADETVPQEMPHIDNGNGSCIKEQASNADESDTHESFKLMLPDNLLASPKKASSSASAESDVSSPIAAATATNTTTTANNIPMLPSTSTFSMASLKSCYLQMPRFTSGQEATES